MPYITSLVLVYLISRSLCLLITIQYSLPQLSTSGNQKFLLFYHELVFVHFLKKNWPSFYFLKHNRVVASLVVQMIKDLPAMQESWVRSIGWEDPLEKGMATHISVLACRFPRTEEPGGPQSLGSQRVAYNWVTNTFTFRNTIIMIKKCIAYFLNYAF